MKMTSGNDGSIAGNNCASGLQSDAGCILQFTGETDGSGDAQSPGVRCRYFYLRGAAGRSQNCHIIQDALWTDQTDTAFREKLAGL